MEPIRRMIQRLDQLESLDGVAKSVSDLVGRAVRPRPVRNLLSGTYVGHPLHPVLTDVPIGAWSMAAILDVLGGRSAALAADLLVKVGVASALPTAAAGLNDWSDTTGAAKRVGLVHAGINSLALTLYLGSMLARGSDSRRLGKALSFSGLAVMTAGAYLGGHLAFTRGVNVNRTAWLEEPDEWTPVLREDELADGQHRTVRTRDLSILLYRKSGVVWAITETCSHMGGPLGQGKVTDGCVECPWHGSTFRFRDGVVVRGPASTPQPSYDTRIRDGRIEIRHR